MLLVRLNIFAFILLDWPLHIRWKGKSDPSSLFQTNVSLLILNVKFVSTFAVTEKRLDDSNSCVSWTFLLQVHFHSSSGLFDFLFARRQNPSLSTNQCKSWIYSLSPVVSPHSTWSPPKSMQLSPKKIAAAPKPTLFAVGPKPEGGISSIRSNQSWTKLWPLTLSKNLAFSLESQFQSMPVLNQTRNSQKLHYHILSSLSSN